MVVICSRWQAILVQNPAGVSGCDGFDHGCRQWFCGRVPKTGRSPLSFSSRMRWCLQSGKKRVLGGTQQPQILLYYVGELDVEADLSDSSALMLRETSNLNLFFGWKIESPWSPREAVSVLVKVASPVPPNFPIHCRPSGSGHHQPAGSHRREGGGGEAKVQRGADSRSGMDPATTDAPPPRLRAPRFIPGSYIDPPRKGRGVSPCHASGTGRCPAVRGPYK